MTRLMASTISHGLRSVFTQLVKGKKHDGQPVRRQEFEMWQVFGAKRVESEDQSRKERRHATLRQCEPECVGGARGQEEAQEEGKVVCGKR